MKIFTPFELSQIEGIEILKANMSEHELQLFLNIPKQDRANKIPTTRLVRKTPLPVKNPVHKSVPIIPHNNDLLQEVADMAKELMTKDFEVNGKTYNLFAMGWKFKFNQNKATWGWCDWRHKTIALSKFLLVNAIEDFEGWRNTMLHEIAHAIDATIRGRSSHDARWKWIAKDIGCDGERCKKIEYKDAVQTKYTLTCEACGHVDQRHKVGRGRKYSCGKCAPKIWNPDYQLTVVKNY